jgi:hypothetical protein
MKSETRDEESFAYVTTIFLFRAWSDKKFRRVSVLSEVHTRCLATSGTKGLFCGKISAFVFSVLSVFFPGLLSFLFFASRTRCDIKS